MIHPYAFVCPVEQLPDVAGVGGAAIEQLRIDDVAVVYSRAADRPAADPRADAVAHGLVVEALAAVTSSVVPVRFGESFAGVAQLAAAVRERLAGIAQGLEHVAGCVEVGVRVASPARRPVVSASTGTGYLRERLAALQDHDAVLNELHEHLQRASRDAQLSSRASFEAAYLVERHRVEDIERCVQAFAAAHPHLTVVCTGPWAPYSFGGGIS